MTTGSVASPDSVSELRVLYLAADRPEESIWTRLTPIVELPQRRLVESRVKCGEVRPDNGVGADTTLDEPRDIGPIERPHFPVGFDGSDSGVHRRPRRESRHDSGSAEPAGDRIELSDPERAALALIRERVLGHTRIELRCTAAAAAATPHFVPDPHPTPGRFVSELLAEQNAVGALRREEWGVERVERRIAAATQRGVTEAIEILEELDRLDADGWDLIAAVLAELGRKITSTI